MCEIPSILSEADQKHYLERAEHSADAIYVIQDRRFVHANPAALRLFAVRGASELIGRRLLDFIHPDFRQAAARSQFAIDVGALNVPPAVQVFVRADGAPVEVEVESVRISFGNAPAWLTIARATGAGSRP